MFVLDIGSTTATATSFGYICFAALAIVLLPLIMTVETTGSIVQSVTAVKNVSYLVMLMNFPDLAAISGQAWPSLPLIRVGIRYVREQDTP